MEELTLTNVNAGKSVLPQHFLQRLAAAEAMRFRFSDSVNPRGFLHTKLDVQLQQVWFMREDAELAAYLEAHAAAGWPVAVALSHDGEPGADHEDLGNGVFMRMDFCRGREDPLILRVIAPEDQNTVN